MNDQRFAAYDHATRKKIAAWQNRPDDSLVEPILSGIARYYVPPEAGLPEDAAPEQAFAAAAIESLTLMEIILDVQEAFDVRFEDSELLELRGYPDIVTLILAKR